ncbi:MAG: bifunctional hydroxymethylpyrimidine kinase/phosphomethylpyrimidine kinase [Acidobacteria bacterium]|nr:bifunctional hydroxymethylpyrimidine kinase/phosphomethylpyrimidine kinase [Acidobacteriota bacterium]
MKDRLLELVDSFAGKRILVYGDLILDQFLFGEISRISREAPVLILKYRETTSAAGGGANAANNAARLGADVITVGVVGADKGGKQLAELLPVGASLIIEERYATPTKVRILGGSSHSPRQQIVRVDYESCLSSVRGIHERLAESLRSAIEQADAIVVSDYGVGTVQASSMEIITQGAAKRNIPVVVDSRFALTDFHNITAMTPNISEVEEALHEKLSHDERRIAEMGKELCRRSGLQALLITRGRFGMTLIEHADQVTHIPIFGSDEVADVTGAGDTVTATFTTALAADASFFEAAMLANYAAGLVVMKRGIATVSAEELKVAVAADG